ncbi:FkbM family methyltransferase [Alphaproteobacteria bacterium]|nr:FkbM family methyltransferase [Alphaproteobacteria bacterium]
MIMKINLVRKTRDLVFLLLALLIGPKLGWAIGRRFIAIAGIGWGSSFDNSGEKKFIKSAIGKKSNPVIFDVGAHVGEYSSFCRKVNSGCELHMFEPSDSHFEVLKSNFSGELEGSQSAVTKLNDFGLSNISAKRTLYKNQDITGIASVHRRDLSYLDISMDIEEECEFLSPTDYLEQSDVTFINLLKLDIEGEEMNVLRGFETAFRKKIIAVCQFEYGHANLDSRINFKDFFNYFKDVEYDLYILLPTGRIDAIKNYSEKYENYYIANFIAMPSEKK